MFVPTSAAPSHHQRLDRSCAQSAPGHAVAATSLAVAFGDHAALTDLTFAVSPGEVVAVLGPNGSGKTTLIECLTCQRTPDSGEVRLFGSARRHLTRQDRARLGVVLQESRTDLAATAPLQCDTTS